MMTPSSAGAAPMTRRRFCEAVGWSAAALALPGCAGQAAGGARTLYDRDPLDYLLRHAGAIARFERTR